MFSQLITNGYFKTDISGWDDGSSPGGSIAWNAGQYMDMIHAGGTVRVSQTINTVPNKQYRVTCSNVGSVNFTVYAVGTTLGTVTLNTAYANSEFDETFTAKDNSTFISLRLFSAGTAKVDNVRMQKLSPFNDIIVPADVPTPIFNDIIRTYAGEEPWHLK
jgi:hypothetical protein